MILYSVMAAIPLLVWDLDATDGGFVSAGSTGQWAWGVPTVGPGGSATVWGTNLHGPYLNDAVDTLELPMPDLTGATRPVLVIDHWHEVRAGDYGVVEVDEGAGWQIVDPIYGYPDTNGFSGNSGGFVRTSVDLSGLAAGARVRLAFATSPTFAAPGWFVRGAELWDGDATAPSVRALTIADDTQDVDGPYPIELTVVDDVDVVGVSVHASFDGAAAVELIAVPTSGDTWRVEIPGQPPGTDVTWYATATDGDLEGRWPATGESGFRVWLPAPTALAGPEGRIVAPEVDLSWVAPEAVEPVLGYVVIEDGREDAPVEVTSTEARVPVDDTGAHTWRVSARFAAGLGDPSEPLTLAVEVPAVHEVDPGLAWAGERLRVRIAGESLYLLDGSSQVFFGDGLQVEELEIVDVNTATALVQIEPDALAGPRPLTISSPLGVWRFDDAFEVGDPAGRPQIVHITPGKIEQGETITVEVTASEPFFDAVTVDAGDLVVASDVVTDGAVARFDLVASGRAALGDHALVLDDGRRLWTTEIEVTERILDPGRCATGGGGVGGWGALIGLLLVGRRARTRQPSAGSD